ncbi:hypothetical protein AKO1_008025 [Acrasis kona]|uniref:VanZ-like domain-containing protein n=1 Tax=Acrasis kona TaxID=1008807 RepID=A0AAW2YRD3_9EUKA
MREQVRHAVRTYKNNQQLWNGTYVLSNVALVVFTILLLYPTGENFMSWVDLSTTSTSNFDSEPEIITQTSQQIIHDPTNELTIRAITDILKILLWDKAQYLAGFGLCFILFVAGRVHFYINPSPLRFDASAFTKYSLRAGMWFVVYACVSEILQYYVPLRNFSWLDMVSNVLGVILGAIIIVCCTVTISHYIKNN